MLARLSFERKTYQAQLGNTLEMTIFRTSSPSPWTWSIPLEIYIYMASSQANDEGADTTNTSRNPLP